MLKKKGGELVTGERESEVRAKQKIKINKNLCESAFAAKVEVARTAAVEPKATR
jgi:hypothetical protein